VARGFYREARYTPLMWAARVGHKDATEVLLQMEPGIDAVNLFGATALCEAVENGHADAASALLDKGADTNVQDIRGNTPMMLATRGGHIDAMRAMLDDPIVAADMGIKNEQGQTALMLAVVYQHIDAVRLLQVGALLLQPGPPPPMQIGVQTGRRFDRGGVCETFP